MPTIGRYLSCVRVVPFPQWSAECSASTRNCMDCRKPISLSPIQSGVVYLVSSGGAGQSASSGRPGQNARPVARWRANRGRRRVGLAVVARTAGYADAGFSLAGRVMGRSSHPLSRKVPVTVLNRLICTPIPDVFRVPTFYIFCGIRVTTGKSLYRVRQEQRAQDVSGHREYQWTPHRGKLAQGA